jgi:hypothetical protein
MVVVVVVGVVDVVRGIGCDLVDVRLSKYFFFSSSSTLCHKKCHNKCRLFGGLSVTFLNGMHFFRTARTGTGTFRRRESPRLADRARASPNRPKLTSRLHEQDAQGKRPSKA